MSFLRIGHPPALVARLSETHERLFFLARAERPSARREEDDATPRQFDEGEEDDRG